MPLSCMCLPLNSALHLPARPPTFQVKALLLVDIQVAICLNFAGLASSAGSLVEARLAGRCPRTPSLVTKY